MTTHVPEDATARLSCSTTRRSISKVSRASPTSSSSEARHQPGPGSSASLSSESTRAGRRCARLRRLVAERSGIEVPVGAADITFHRDDVHVRGGRAPSRQPVVRATSIPFSIEDLTVVLVDDVLFTGRTIRAAIDALLEFGRPARVQLAVLVDRGHRELPIRPDYVGKNLPTGRAERIQVELVEIDERDGVFLVAELARGDDV